MYNMLQPLVILTLLILFAKTNFAHECVWAVGKLVCQQDPSAVDAVEIRLWDWDGGVFWDPDDQMGYDISEPNGEFRIGGCASDLFPWNKPDPYLEIRHYCGTQSGATIETDVKRTFVPYTSDFGTIKLD